MAFNSKSQALETSIETRSPELEETELQEEEYDEEDLEELERDLEQMAEKISNYRATFPDQLKNTLASILHAQRPIMEGSSSISESEPLRDLNPDYKAMESNTEEKVRLLRDTVSSNISTLPVVVKRLNECLSSIDNLGSYNGTIPSVFKKTKTSLADQLHFSPNRLL